MRIRQFKSREASIDPYADPPSVPHGEWKGGKPLVFCYKVVIGKSGEPILLAKPDIDGSVYQVVAEGTHTMARRMAQIVLEEERDRFKRLA